MHDFLTYEQPLNERIRTFLRLEKLFKQYAFHGKHGSIWNTPTAVEALLEMIAFTSRGDIKLEILKELEKQHSRLNRLSKKPQVDHNHLDSLLVRQKKLLAELQATTGQLGKELQDVELLKAIRQKSSVPGCICDFDLPVFHYWLHRPEVVRRKHLQEWFECYTVLDRSIALILELLRGSVQDSDEIARNGFFQKTMDTNQAIQLLRVSIASDSPCYPDISAGKHRFSVRFMTNDDPGQRPQQCREDIPFRLGMCLL